MQHFRHGLGAALLALGMTFTDTAPAAAEAVPLHSGKLVEVKRATAFADITATPGVVLVDCFADW